MVDLATILAVLIIIAAVPAIVANALYVWRNRQGLDIGLLIILVTGGALALWSGVGYLIIVLTQPPTPMTLNVILLRPLQIFWNILWTAAPVHLSARSQAIGQGAELHEVRVKFRECREEAAKATMKLINAEQAIEMKESIFRRLTELLEMKDKEIEALRDGK